jgi:hypothetical protein
LANNWVYFILGTRQDRVWEWPLALLLEKVGRK